jgi:hypothetical protein
MTTHHNSTRWAWVTQHPPVHHPKIPVQGFHGWDEVSPRGQLIWSVLFFFRQTFSLGAHCFFLPGYLWFNIFFHQPWNLFFFFFGNSYLPLQPTYHSSSYQPIYLSHSTHPSFVLVLPSIISTWNSMGPWFKIAELWVSKAWKEWRDRLGEASSAWSFVECATR